MALLLLLLLLLVAAERSSARLFLPQRFPLPVVTSSFDAIPALALSDFERDALRSCPCADASQCLPLAFGGGGGGGGDDNQQTTAKTNKKRKKEVYAFSVTTTDEWKRYDWDQVRALSSAARLLACECIVVMRTTWAAMLWCISCCCCCCCC